MNNPISIEDINSSGIVSMCRESGITHIEKIGRYEHPEHPGSNDWAITLYKLDNFSGGRVADTNADPIFEDADPSGFSELLANYGITMKTTLKKEIGWSYPSSPNALRFGFGESGCWTVSLTDQIRQTDRAALPLALSGHATAIEAVNAADALPYEYSRYSAQFGRDSYAERETLCEQSTFIAATI